mmetsp:Transcript_4863/g.13640  ORF Transcript_4863/g.13640 Transcript_4863/m.13640 type:complete len:232 (-) Transcript_4863:107-802(-)
MPQLAGTVSYLLGATGGRMQAPSVRAKEDLLDPSLLDRLLRQRAVHMADAALRELQDSAVARGVGIWDLNAMIEGPVWNAANVGLIRLAKVHGWYILQSTFAQQLGAAQELAALPSATREVLRDLQRLFVLTHMEDTLGDFFEAGVVSPQVAEWVHQCVRDLLARLRPEAVALVDAFALEDYYLNSAIGKQDGDVYSALYAMAQRSPFNRTDEGPAWNDLLGPFLTQTSKL